jgi:hypothetical protein
MIKERYYVQCLSEQIFLIRERMSIDKGPGPNDRLVRSFNVRHDAFMYANEINDKQRELDENYGHWTQQAIGER